MRFPRRYNKILKDALIVYEFLFSVESCPRENEGSVHRTRNKNGSDKSDPYFKNNTLYEKSFEF